MMERRQKANIPLITLGACQSLAVAVSQSAPVVGQFFNRE